MSRRSHSAHDRHPPLHPHHIRRRCHRGDHRRVRHAGDVHDQPALEGALERPGLQSFTLDLSGLTFIDSLGLGVVTRLAAELEARGIPMRILPGPPPVQRVFTTAGLAHALPFKPNSLTKNARSSTRQAVDQHHDRLALPLAFSYTVNVTTRSRLERHAQSPQARLARRACSGRPADVPLDPEPLHRCIGTTCARSEEARAASLSRWGRREQRQLRLECTASERRAGRALNVGGRPASRTPSGIVSVARSGTKRLPKRGPRTEYKRGWSESRP